jgi:uncharacterized protein YuzB (UPF0349 family)
MNLIVMGEKGCSKAQDSSHWNFSKVTDQAMANLETSYYCTNPTSIDSDSSETGSVISILSHGTDEDSEYTTKDDNSDAMEDDCMEDDVLTVKPHLSGRGNCIIDFFSLQAYNPPVIVSSVLWMTVILFYYFVIIG